MEKENTSSQEKIRKEKLDKLRHLGINPYSDGSFKPNLSIEKLILLFKEIKTKDDLAQNQKLSSKKVKIYGRVMLSRSQGKAGFLQIKDFSAKIQIYCNKKILSDKDFEVWQLIDLGDIIGIEGNLMITNTGELTVRAKKIHFLTKSLKPLPEKHSGLVDVEERYRKRYLDLISNDQIKDIFVTRFKIIRSIQNFLDKLGYIEVETPMLHSTLGGASARPFETFHNSLKLDLKLRIATELHLKRLIVGGFEKVYEIGRIFRNEGISPKHNPEFTSIELYQANGNLDTMFDLTEKMIKNVVYKITNSFKIYSTQSKNTIDFEKPFIKISMNDLIKKHVKVDFAKINSLNDAKKIAKLNKIEIKKHYDIGHIMNEFFEKFCQDKLIQPTFVYDFPLSVSPLAKKSLNNDKLTQRFELFIDGKECANAFSELSDPQEQKKRFLNQLKEKELGSKEDIELDNDFLNALKYGMPPTGGMGLGIDRLVMLITDKSNIREVLLFPLLKNK